MVSSTLLDRFGRSIDYMRLSVTDRCDLRCSYCMPKGFRGFEEPKDWLTFGLSMLPGLQDLSLSTNATQLGRHAVALRAAGVSRINVSLDSLDRACMQSITGRDSLQPILDGLMAGKAAGFEPIKINMVAMRGINEDQIEAMPMGSTGRNAQYMPLGAVRERLTQKFGLAPQALELGGGPARYLSTADGQASIGFVTPMSQHFCRTCNRVRLSVEGSLYLCLAQEEKLAFGPMLRSGASDTELEAAIRMAVELKPQQHDFNTQPDKIIRFMAQTGG